VAYASGGDQYVAVLAGWGGVFPAAAGEVSFASGRVRNVSRVLVFKLGGRATLPVQQPVEQVHWRALPNPATTATIRKGEGLFQSYCAGCHGDVAVSGGVLPDLRASETLRDETWFDIVLRGALQSQGMVSFSKELSREDASAIRSYVIFRRNQESRSATQKQN
jgi:alcohol dehydrogenase (cytochrome c)/quinohemoprotein ethanol dehydrogenase